MYGKGLTERIVFRTIENQKKDLVEYSKLYKQSTGELLREALAVWLNMQTLKNKGEK